MYVDLPCGECGDLSRVPFATLYEVWSEGYDSMDAESRDRATVVANITCHCGHEDVYEGIMFQYVFQLIFDEFIKAKESHK